MQPAAKPLSHASTSLSVALSSTIDSGRDTSPEDVPSCACKMGLQAPAEGEECCMPPDSPSASSCASASSGPLKDEPSSGWSTYEFLRFAGPGMLMMTAFIDPGDLESDIQIGSVYRFKLLWISLWATVCGYTMQMLAAKLGVASGKDLAQWCGAHYPWPVRYVLWLIIEASLVAVEIQYIFGGAVGLSVLSNGIIPLWAGSLLSAVVSFMVLLLDIWGIKLMETAFMLIISVMVVTFAVLAGVAGAPGTDVIKGLAIPNLPPPPPGEDPSFVYLLAGGIIGGNISPYNFYFYSRLVLKREIPLDTRGEKKTALKYYYVEGAFALFLALFINVCLVCVFAMGFYGDYDYASENLGFLNAGTLLGAIWGNWVTYIWGVGVFATAFSSTAATIYAGQAIMEGFVDIKVEAWKRGLATRLLAFVPSVIVACVMTNPDQIDQMNLWLNLLQTIALPFALIPLVHFSTNLKVMGKYFVNGPYILTFAIAITLFAVFMAIYCTWQSTPLPTDLWAQVLSCFGLAAYIFAIAYCAINPDRAECWWWASIDAVRRVLGYGPRRTQGKGNSSEQRSEEQVQVQVEERAAGDVALVNTN